MHNTLRTPIRMPVPTRGSYKRYANLVSRCTGSFGKWQIMVMNLLVWYMFLVSWVQEKLLLWTTVPAKYFCSDFNQTKCSKECTKYIFNETRWTVQEEFNMICDWEWLVLHLDYFAYSGAILGNIIFGYISDKCGRKMPLSISVFLQSSFGMLMYMAPRYWFFMLFYILFYSIAFVSIRVIGLILLLELVGLKYRAKCSLLFLGSELAGTAFYVGIDYLIENWRYFQFFVILANCIFIIYWCYLPESPRWLLLKGRLDEAIEILEIGARMNKKDEHEIKDIIYNLADRSAAGSEGLKELFKSSYIRDRAIYVWINCFIISFTAWSARDYVQFLQTVYVNSAALYLIQIPTLAVLCYTLDKYGRRKTMLTLYIFFILVFILIAVQLSLNQLSWAPIILGSLATVTSNCCWITLFIYSVELFPTAIRCKCVSYCYILFKLAILLYLVVKNSLATYERWVPPAIISGVAFAGLIVTNWVPETKDVDIPDTIEDADEFDIY